MYKVLDAGNVFPDPDPNYVSSRKFNIVKIFLIKISALFFVHILKGALTSSCFCHRYAISYKMS